MIRGIGVDTTSISELTIVISRLSDGAVARMFTKSELAISCGKTKPDEYLASRFAAKEAVFKAVAHLLGEKHFDLRLVETLNRDDGSPYISIDERLNGVLSRAGVSRLHVSITTQGDFATAFVVAE